MDTMVLKIDGVEGEASIKSHEKEITCHSFSHSVHQHLKQDVANTGRSVGRVEHSEFTIKKDFDKATTSLIEKCNTGTDLGTIVFTVLRATGTSHEPQIVITMEHAMVGSVAMAGGGDDVPKETVNFVYAKIKWEYKVQDDNAAVAGSVATEWDMITNAN